MKNENSLEINKNISKENELVLEALKNLDISDFVRDDDEEDNDEGISDFYMDAVKYNCYINDIQLCKLFENRVDIESLMSDADIMLKYRYEKGQGASKSARFITNTLESLIKNVDIAEDEYYILYRNLSIRLNENNEDYYTKLKTQVENIPTKGVFGFLFDNDIDYLKFMISNGLDATDGALVVYTLYRYYPYDIQKLFCNDIKDICSNYREKLRKAKMGYKSQSIVKSIDTKMKELLLNNYADRIAEMYKSGLSFGKIQKELTKECIQKDEIPVTIKRYDRTSGSDGEKIERPALLPMSAIKSIINDANVQISKVGRYTKAK